MCEERKQRIESSEIGNSFQNHIYVLTPEGSRKFFELMEQPNPAADRTRERGKSILSPEQRKKLGKEPVKLVFKPRKENEEHE